MTIRTARYILDLVRSGNGARISSRSIRHALLVTGDLQSTFRKRLT